MNLKNVISTILIAGVVTAHAQTAINDGDWATNATWQSGTSPGFTNLTDPVINAYVTANSGLTYDANNARSLTVNDTLIVYGNVSFDVNKNNASVNIGANNVLIIYGDLEMGKNSAGVNVEAGGVMVVTGTISASGVEGTSTISGAGKVYSNNPTGLDDGSIGEGSVQTIDDLSGDGYDTIEEFVSGGGASPLPVELIFFEAASKDGVRLSWATASEINNEYFSIERSEDGYNFYEIGRINGNGNTSQITNYEFIDKFSHAPIEYYRLRQVDFDGRSEYFDIQRVSTGFEKVQNDIKVYPTVIRNGSLTLTSTKPTQIQSIQMYGLSGGETKNLTQSAVQENPINYRMNLSGFEKGIYILKVTYAEGDQITSRIVIE